MDVIVTPQVREYLGDRGSSAVVVDVTLRFCGGAVTKDAVAVAGEPPSGAGFNHLSGHGVDIFWRQRFEVEGTDPRVEPRVSPKQMRLSVRDSELTAEVSY